MFSANEEEHVCCHLRHCDEYFTYVSSFDPYNSFEEVDVIFPIFTEEETAVQTVPSHFAKAAN